MTYVHEALVFWVVHNIGAIENRKGMTLLSTQLVLHPRDRMFKFDCVLHFGYWHIK